ncbi:MAG: polysaccharide deacetylase family protein [Caulobacteraceae bacterium]
MAAYSADRSLKGKLRRRLARLADRRPARVRLERPMVSFSFDDAPVSAAGAGAGILERRGARATYFIATGLAGETGPMGANASLEEIGALMAAGHEIACHTHSHLDCGKASAEAMDADVRRNQAALAAIGAPAPVAFAYPYGEVSRAAKQTLGGRFAVLRALHHGLIEDGADLNQAPAVGIEGPHGEAVAAAWLERALARNAWLILYSHDVGQTPSPWGCRPDALERLVDRALGGGADVVTVGEGARRIGARAGGRSR